MLARLLTVAIAVLIAFGIAEIALRISAAEIDSEIVAREAEEERSGLRRLDSLFDLVQRHQRGINVGVLYESNSFGIRGPERTIVKAPDAFRTIVIGDSFAMGSGVPYEDTYAARLERTLSTISDRRHEVINLGISGLSLKDSMIRYENLGAQFGPNLLVYAYTINDLEGPSYLRVMQCSERREGHRDSWSYIWRRIGETWLWLEEELRKPEGSYPYELELNYFSNDAAWTAFDAELIRLAEEARKRKICAVVLVQTQLRTLNRHHAYSAIYDRVGEAAAAKGLFVVQTFPYFEGIAPKELWVSFADIHPNAKGHEILAKALTDGIESLPASCFPSMAVAP
jgi:lysophospholipase L1-like esterase